MYLKHTQRLACAFPNEWHKDYQYKSTDKILVFGEMDFSFSLALFAKIPDCNMMSTAYYSSVDSIPSKCRDEAKTNIAKLVKMGCVIKFNVNAELVKPDKLGDTGLFDKIIFTFPREYSKTDSQQKSFIKNIMNKLSIFVSNNSDQI